MGLLQTVAPTEEPVSLVTAKLHCRVDTTDEDSLLTTLIAAARQYCENFTRRQFVTSTWQYYIDRFPAGADRMRIPLPPLQSVSKILYHPASESHMLISSWTTLAATKYIVNTNVSPGQISPAYNEVWPTSDVAPLLALIEFVCGYGAASAVPAAIKQAMLLLIGHWYTNRQDVVTGAISTRVHRAVDALLMPFKTGWIDFSTNKVEAA